MTTIDPSRDILKATFQDGQLASVKLGILLASLVAALLGSAIFLSRARPNTDQS